MQISGLHITNFLSFQEFAWPNLDLRLNIVVGPNGAGKTNLLLALRTVRDVVGRARRCVSVRRPLS